MKKVLLLFTIFLSTIANAQNWNSIVVGDTSYYLVQAPLADSIWQGYLRGIWVDSSVNAAGVTTNYFYPSIRLNAVNIIDTSGGDTWLGRRMIRDVNGEELFFNKQGDTLTIKTLANLSDTWKFSTDSNNIEYFATVNVTDTMTIDGVLDSIKIINLQAFTGSTPVASFYNNLPIILSKHYGFYSVFEFYAFPYHVNPLDSVDYFPYPILPFIHTRINKSVTQTNYKDIDFSFKYLPGNEWIQRWDSYKNSWIRHDSILSFTYLSPNSIEVDFYRHSYHRYKIQPPMGFEYDTSFHIYSTIKDTITNGSFGSIRQLKPEHKSTIQFETYAFPNAYSTRQYFVTYLCGKLKVKDSAKFQSLVSGGGSDIFIWTEGFGESQFIHSFYQIMAEGWGYSTVYFKLGSCVDGVKFNFKTLDINDIYSLKNNIVLYPNPSSEFIYINGMSNASISLLHLFDLQGRRIHSWQNVQTNQPIDISLLKEGNYILRIETDTGKVNKLVTIH